MPPRSCRARQPELGSGEEGTGAASLTCGCGCAAPRKLQTPRGPRPGSTWGGLCANSTSRGHGSSWSESVAPSPGAGRLNTQRLRSSPLRRCPCPPGPLSPSKEPAFRGRGSVEATNAGLHQGWSRGGPTAGAPPPFWKALLAGTSRGWLTPGTLSGSNKLTRRTPLVWGGRGALREFAQHESTILKTQRRLRPLEHGATATSTWS